MQSIRSLVAPGVLLRETAGDEDQLVLHAPPFRTLADAVALNREYWAEVGALWEIDPESVLLLGDFGLGSDTAIVLELGGKQRVLRLRWCGVKTSWVVWADSLAGLLERLGLCAGHGFIEGVVGGRGYSAISFRVRTTNFGQRWRVDGVRTVGYELRIPISEVRRFTATVPSDPNNRIGSEDDSALLAVVRELDYDLLKAVLGDGTPTVWPAFIINTVDTVARDGRTIVLQGLAAAAETIRAHPDV